MTTKNLRLKELNPEDLAAEISTARDEIKKGNFYTQEVVLKEFE